MRILIPSIFFALFMALPAAQDVRADEDYFLKAFNPPGAEDKSNQIYPAYDFDDVIFTREYFYSLEEGKLQMERSGTGAWQNNMEMELETYAPAGGADESGADE